MKRRTRDENNWGWPVPAVPTQVIDRVSLLNRLDEVPQRPLTVVTGPAGSGKSVLVAQWCQQRCSLPVAWVQVNRHDGTARLVHKVVTALHDLAGTDPGPPNDGDVGHIIAGQASSLDSATTDLMAELMTGAAECVVVIDDVNRSELAGLVAELALTLERAHGSGIHLIAVGRHAPSPAIIPLRLRGKATHLDAADLELDGAETANVVASYSGITISATTGEHLSKRLEGWMAGAVIVGMSHPGSSECTADELIDAAFDDIDAYVTAEVLSTVDSETQRFLLLSACVDDAIPVLCDLMTGRSDSDRLLNELRQSGVPIKRRGARSGSARYLRPVREVLDAHSARDDPQARAAALRIAADWYSDARRPFDAADCWVRLGQWDQVIGVIMMHLQQILEEDEIGRLSALVDKAPPAVLREHAAIALAGGWVLRMDGRIAAAYELVGIYEPYMTDIGKMVANVVRSGVASWVEDVEGVYDFAVTALAACEVLGDDAVAARPKALPSYMNDSTDTYRILANANALLACSYGGMWEHGPEHLVDLTPATIATLPQPQIVQVRGYRATFLALSGRVAEASAEARAAIALATDSGLLEHRSTADAFYAIGEAQRLALQHDQADDAFAQSRTLAELNARHNLISAIVASRAHRLVDAGQAREAQELIAEHRAGSPQRPPKTLAGMLAAAEARALAADGGHRHALRVLDLAPQTTMTASARVAVSLAAGDLSVARETVANWPVEPTVDSSVRHALALAVVHDMMGERAGANASIRIALVTAADHQLAQPFIEFGPLITRLLRRAGSNDTEPAARDLADHVSALIIGGTVAALAPRFTAREAVVLSHLAQGMSLAEVGKTIHLSVNTVKTHVKAIYRKLGVNTRLEAITAWQSAQPTAVDD